MADSKATSAPFASSAKKEPNTPPARRCPACGAGGVAPWRKRSKRGALTSKDLAITDAHYGTTLELLRCRGCGFVFAVGGDDAELSRLVELYRELDDPEYAATVPMRRLQMDWLLDRTLSQVPNARTLLDIGCASGVLLEAAQARGLAATGLEPSHKLAAQAEARGLQVLCGVLPDERLAGKSFDLVTLVDVIEHVPEPVPFLSAAAAHLAQEGTLLVVTPNLESWASQLLGHRWWHFRAAHVGYFSPYSFRRAAGRAGLRVVERFSVRWYFPVDYLAERAVQYLPESAEPVARGLWSRLSPWLGQQVVPLELWDSDAYLLRRIED